MGYMNIRHKVIQSMLACMLCVVALGLISMVRPAKNPVTNP